MGSIATVSFVLLRGISRYDTAALLSIHRYIVTPLAFTHHQSIFMQRDLKVCSQLGYPMLNDDAQVAPTRDKPSPGTARRDQSMQMRQEGRRERVT